jgi:hypothetical protein
MEREGSLLCSQDTTTGLQSEAHESNRHIHQLHFSSRHIFSIYTQATGEVSSLKVFRLNPHEQNMSAAYQIYLIKIKK